jgi:Transposase DDE domain
MRRVLATDAGGELYAKRQTVIEPIFADTKFNRRIRPLLRRGRSAARSEWRLANAGHNLLKPGGTQPHLRPPESGPGARRRRHRPANTHKAASAPTSTSAFTQQPPREAGARPWGMFTIVLFIGR